MAWRQSQGTARVIASASCVRAPYPCAEKLIASATLAEVLVVLTQHHAAPLADVIGAAHTSAGLVVRVSVVAEHRANLRADQPPPRRH